MNVPEEIGDSDILEVVRPSARPSDPEISGERESSEELEDLDALLAMVPRGGRAPVIIPVTLDSALDVTGDPAVEYWSSPALPDFDDRETEVKISTSSFPSAPASGIAPAPASSAAPISLLPPINPPPRRDGAAAPSLAPVAMPSAPPSAAAAPMRGRSKSVVIIHGRPSVVWTCGLLAAGALAAAAVALVVNAREQGGVRSTRAAAAALMFEQPTPRAGHLGAAVHAPTPPDADAEAAAASVAGAEAPKGKSAVAASASHASAPAHAAPRPAPRAPAVAAKPAPATHAAVAAASAPAKPAAATAPASPRAAAAKPMSPEDADALAREQLKAALR